MPNWCWNSVTFTHKDPAMLQRFVKASETGILQEFVPCPDELIEAKADFTPKPDLMEKYGYNDWYDWRLANWGTKWDFTCDAELNGDTISTGFDTAWAPPIAAYRTLEEMGFEIEAYYHEPGMGFAGKYEFGEEEYCEYDFSDDNWRDTMSDDVADMLESEYDFYLQMKAEEEAEEAEAKKED
jgi:hypothetical protein